MGFNIMLWHGFHHAYTPLAALPHNNNNSNRKKKFPSHFTIFQSPCLLVDFSTCPILVCTHFWPPKGTERWLRIPVVRLFWVILLFGFMLGWLCYAVHATYIHNQIYLIYFITEQVCVTNKLKSGFIIILFYHFINTYAFQPQLPSLLQHWPLPRCSLFIPYRFRFAYMWVERREGGGLAQIVVAKHMHICIFGLIFRIF